jgi:multiple sugar transport system permease protein
MMVEPAANRRFSLALRYAALISGGIILTAPFAYMIATSLTTNALILDGTPDLILDNPTLSNYGQAWGGSHFGRYFLNSLAVATATTAGTLIITSMTAYGFARFSFPGKEVIFGALIAGLTVPTILLIVPQFLLARDLRLLDSLPGLLPFYIGTSVAFNTFLLRAFFERIPRELDEAMIVDGASTWRRYWSLAIPLARPALATVAIFSFLGAWDEFAWALTVINDVNKRTLPIGLALFVGQHGTQWGLLFAASVIAVVPVVAVYVIFQRQIISGLTDGAIKS